LQRPCLTNFVVTNVDGPQPTLAGHLDCCGAARETGLSLQVQIPTVANSHNADFFAVGKGQELSLPKLTSSAA
jgi:hypothetical protein